MEGKYKIAPLGRIAHVLVGDSEIVELKPSGDKRQSLSLADLSYARWTRYDRKGTTVRTLALKGESSSFTLTLSAPTRGSLNAEDVAAFNEIVGACLDKIEAAKPDMEVFVGPPPFISWLFFAGSLGVGVVLLIPLDGVLNHRKADELWWVAAVLGACILGVVAFAFVQRPWKRQESISPSALKREVLAGQRR